MRKLVMLLFVSAALFGCCGKPVKPTPQLQPGITVPGTNALLDKPIGKF
mgnify:CR=1 FL=1|jgi:hypothetical protein